MDALTPPLLPARASLGVTGLHVALADIRPGELSDPFLQDTLRRLPRNLQLAHVPHPEVAPANAGAAPAGLIFPVARCGSTLVSQLLKLQPRISVYSEPPAINELLAPPLQGDRARLVGALREVAAMFSKHAEGPYVIKLSSWNVLFGDMLAEAFPDTPWALCLRDPIEVCVSLLARPPGWLKETSPLRNHLGPLEGAAGLSAEQRVAHAYASFCTAARRLSPSLGSLVDYEELPDAIWRIVLPRFGIQADDRTIERMQAASRIDAKAPFGQAKAFEHDAARKRSSATAAVRAEVEAIARPALDRLLAHMATAPLR